MAHPGDSGGMRIGEVLKSARTRQGIDIAEVEERTKIRTKYLRALESEDWDVLPNPAYAKGFLRTYSQMLGLDADAIVDEYVRQVESRLEPGGLLGGVGEPVLEGRRRPANGGPSRLGTLGLVLVGVAAVVGILLVVGLIGGDEGGEGDRRPAAREKAKKDGGKDGGGDKDQEQPAEPKPPQTVSLQLSVNSEVQVCLVGANDSVLIAGQVLSAGTEESFEQPRFLLRFPSGYDRSQFDLTIDGKPGRLPEVTGPAAYVLEPGEKPRAKDPPGEGCP